MAFLGRRQPFRPRTAKLLLPSGIAYDAVSNSGYQTLVSSLSWSHTWSGSNRMLAVDVSMLSVTDTVTAMTYGGATCTFVGGQNVVGGTGRVENWRICQNDSGAPATGANTISVTLSGSVACAGTAVSYTNVNQSSPTEGWNGNSGINAGSGTNATVAVTTVADKDWVHAALATSQASGIASSQTDRNVVAGAAGTGANSDTGPITPAGSQTMTWTGEGITAMWATAGYGIRSVNASRTAYTIGGTGGSAYGSVLGSAAAYVPSQYGGTVLGSQGNTLWASSPVNYGGVLAGSQPSVTTAYATAQQGGTVDGSVAGSAWVHSESGTGGATDGSSSTTSLAVTQSPSGGTAEGSQLSVTATYSPVNYGGTVDGSGSDSASSCLAAGTGGTVDGSAVGTSSAYTNPQQGGSVSGSAGGSGLAVTSAGTGGTSEGSTVTAAWVVMPQNSGGTIGWSVTSIASSYSPILSGGTVAGSQVNTAWVHSESAVGGGVGGSECSVSGSTQFVLAGTGGLVAGSGSTPVAGSVYLPIGGLVEGSVTVNAGVYAVTANGGTAEGSAASAAAPYVAAAFGGSVDGSSYGGGSVSTHLPQGGTAEGPGGSVTVAWSPVAYGGTAAGSLSSAVVSWSYSTASGGYVLGSSLTINVTPLVPLIAGTWVELERGTSWTEYARPLLWKEKVRSIVWSTDMPLMTLVERLGESAVYAYDFKNDAVILSGDTLASVTSVTATARSPNETPAPALPTLGTPNVQGTKATVEITGTQDEAEYVIRFVVQTTGGFTRVGLGILDVNED